MSGPESIRPSEPPRSSFFPGRPSGNTPYAIGIVVLALLIGGLILVWKLRSSETEVPPPRPSAKPSATETSAGPLPEFAPPPPPDLEDAGSDAGPDADADAATTKAAGKATGKPGTKGGVCDACGKGESTGALQAAVRGRAALARGCYNRALAVAGNLTVSVAVGVDGRVCSAGIVSDTVGSPQISQCVAAKFRGGNFPRPARGCVVLNVPISFKTK